mmetsp:Transcript_6369/g.14648  ORF Transcript_6369/g.14648 Transcript_6369/m.14648 type:complete len:256 (-) Transcript_6369:23-790(-)
MSQAPLVLGCLPLGPLLLGAMRKQGTTGKAAAGARMAAAHRERMKDFCLPAGACAPREDSDSHCAACFEQSMCQHPYCGTCRFCVARGAFSHSRQLLDYQCMCEKCAVKMNRCCACGKAFNGKPQDVNLPIDHGGEDSDESPAGLLYDVPRVERDWDARMAAAIELAEQYSGYSRFHDSYPPLFAKLWVKYDPERYGQITADQARLFAEDMVAQGWKDWKPSDDDLSLWHRIEMEFGGISLEHFAEASENPEFAI